MVAFYENWKRLKELEQFILLYDCVEFYKEPVKEPDFDLYYIVIVEHFANKNFQLFNELMEKWYVQDVRNGVLYKDKFHGYADGINRQWFISKDDYDELVKLGLKTDYPLTTTDALRFLEGKSNYSISNPKCKGLSVDMQIRMDKKFNPLGDKYMNENIFEVANYCVGLAIDIVKNDIAKNRNRATS